MSPGGPGSQDLQGTASGHHVPAGLLLAKFKLNSVEDLISQASIDSKITRNEFVLIKNVPKEFDDIKGESKNSNDI